MTDDRPSIAELQRLSRMVLESNRPDHIHNAAEIVLSAWQPLLLEIAAAALAWRMVCGDTSAAAKRKAAVDLLNAVAKVRP